MSARVNGDDPADPASTNDSVSSESAGAPVTSAAGAAASDQQGASAGDTDTDGMFECNICFEQAKDAVVSLCGHLFCWPCLHTWLETKRDCQVCPVCKAAISRDKVVPLYGRNSGQTSDSRADPRDKPPPRPAGQRSEPEQSNSFGGFNLGDANFHFSFGIGAFPLGFIASAFNIGGAGNNTHAAFGPDHPYHADDQTLSTLFLALGIICVLWLLCM